MIGLMGVDLRDLTDAKKRALSREAIRRRISIHELLAALITEASERLLGRDGTGKEAA